MFVAPLRRVSLGFVLAWGLMEAGGTVSIAPRYQSLSPTGAILRNFLVFLGLFGLVSQNTLDMGLECRGIVGGSERWGSAQRQTESPD